MILILLKFSILIMVSKIINIKIYNKIILKLILFFYLLFNF